MNTQETHINNNDRYVYIWKYPENMDEGAIFYVGQGKHQKSKKYLRSVAVHYQDRKLRKSYAQKVFDKIVKLGENPIVLIYADNLTVDEAHAMEKLLIATYGRRNNNTGILCNLTDGGEINPMCDPEVRLRQLNSVRTPEHRLKRSIGASIVNARPEVLQQNITNTKKMWENIEFRKKMIEKHNSPEMLEKHRRVQSELTGIKVIHNGVEYMSKNELARALGMSLQMLSYRLKNDIPLDLPKFKTKQG
jgi:hypothetical protein